MISLSHVSKKFKLYKRPSDRLLEWSGFGKRHGEFHALRDINLTVGEGRTVGIVGVNGAGKSTLLKLITGTLLPTEGTIEIRGRVAALLELSTGFHPEFTGRQNIHVNGQLLGLSHEQVRELEPEIIAFSELGGFIDQPLRTYSSGMVVRLGFSIAASVQPQVLIIDEALSVGDARFSQKCIRRIKEFREQGTTILFVSHDPGAVTTLCDEAVLLNEGRIVGQGAPRDILEEYNALLAAKGSGNLEMRISRGSSEEMSLALRRHGSFEAFVTGLRLLRANGAPSDVYTPTETMRIQFRAHFRTHVESPTIGFMIKDRLGLSIYGTNSFLKGRHCGPFAPGDAADIEIAVPLRLAYGDYSITVAIHHDETHLDKCYEWTDNAAIFHVRHEGKPDWSGMVVLDPTFTISAGKSTAAEIASHAAQLASEQAESPLKKTV
ncbi:MAG TPA: ABC transporter ATP-binding protein [Candidatus Sumerlaeota bacterium]|nr:ABC transporter ATP-binding protein [Candidatus Sumerlaeota bacterium]